MLHQHIKEKFSFPADKLSANPAFSRSQLIDLHACPPDAVRRETLYEFRREALLKSIDNLRFLFGKELHFQCSKDLEIIVQLTEWQ